MLTKHFTITQEDVWGKWRNSGTLLDRGMVVAQGYGQRQPNDKSTYEDWKKTVKVSDICPVWKDRLGYKSVTVICDKSVQNQVEYWLQYVHGSSCVSRKKELKDGKVALRSDYMCW